MIKIILILSFLGSGAFADVASGPCPEISGKQEYESVNVREAGYDPSGKAVYAKVWVTFRPNEKEVDWQRSDVMESSDYTCDPLEGQIKNSRGDILGYFLTGQDFLLWQGFLPEEGAWYKKHP